MQGLIKIIKLIVLTLKQKGIITGKEFSELVDQIKKYEKESGSNKGKVKKNAQPSQDYQEEQRAREREEIQNQGPLR
jgi:hypothetical protein